MKIKTFSQFIISKKINEDDATDLDLSANDGAASFHTGYYGKNPQEIIVDETGSSKIRKNKKVDILELESIKGIVKDLSERVGKLKKK